LAEYPPEILAVSGGDPLLVGQEVHLYLKAKLKTTRLNIIVNPLSLRYKKQNLETVNLYSQVGVSLNTEDEMRAFEDIRDGISAPITFITNFSLLNLYLVDSLSELIKSAPWQVQFTMTKDSSITIYDKNKALEKLNSELGKRAKKGWPIIAADNANVGECGAGINSLGLLHDGSIIPCLSMRSWSSSLDVQGNIKTDDLKTVWLTKFRDSRFDDCTCCKDFCQKALIAPVLPIEPYTIKTTELPWVTMPAPTLPNNFSQVTVYAVFTPPFNTGPTHWPITMSAGSISLGDVTGESTTTTE